MLLAARARMRGRGVGASAVLVFLHLSGTSEFGMLESIQRGQAVVQRRLLTATRYELRIRMNALQTAGSVQL